MDNPIFRKLQDAIEHPCRTKDWCLYDWRLSALFLTDVLPRFGMAEQAINTVYLLGEHPDQLCNELIKNLTRRAFGSPAQASFKQETDAMDEDPLQEPGSVAPSAISQCSQVHHDDVGDAFKLSQLIFTVGHIIIKHIVFLEFVEKEWKRQKEEREKEEKEKEKEKNKRKSMFLVNI
jgi:condensin complex subunit 1